MELVSSCCADRLCVVKREKMQYTLKGKELTRKQTKLVEAWVLLHTDELRASWTAYRNDGELSQN